MNPSLPTIASHRLKITCTQILKSKRKHRELCRIKSWWNRRKNAFRSIIMPLRMNRWSWQGREATTTASRWRSLTKSQDRLTRSLKWSEKPKSMTAIRLLGMKLTRWHRHCGRMQKPSPTQNTCTAANQSNSTPTPFPNAKTRSNKNLTTGPTPTPAPSQNSAKSNTLKCSTPAKP